MHVVEFGTPPGQEDDLGFLQFLLPLLGVASQINSANAAKDAAASQARAAASLRKAEEAKARAKEAATRAQLQIAMTKKVPKWLLPVAIGTGVVVLVGGGYLLLRPKRRR